jgi:hypothetical protein
MIATQPSPSYPFGFFLPPNTPNKPMNAALMFRSINPKTFKNEKNVLLVFFLVHMKKKETPAMRTDCVFILVPGWPACVARARLLHQRHCRLCCAALVFSPVGKMGAV